MFDENVQFGPEQYQELFRLLNEWRGRDASEQTAAIPQLLEDIAQLAQAQRAMMVFTAPEAA